MATIQKLSNGMEDGVAAINANDTAINTELIGTTAKATALTKTASYKRLPADNSNLGSGQFGFYRNGNNVRLTGYFKLAKGWSANAALDTIPAGYIPTADVQIPIYGDKTYLGRITAGSNKFISTVAIPVGTYIWFDKFYATADDFPA